MVFNSLGFLFFFPITAITYFLLPKRFRWLLLLAASYVFYLFWKPEYVFLLMTSTLVGFIVAIKVEDNLEPGRRRRWFGLGIFVLLGLLVLFKYFNFFNDNVRALFAGAGVHYPIPDSRLVIPLGISFYTFQILAYLSDVYQKRIQSERHPGIFFLFVGFFPQLAAGPIERARNMLHQFRKDHVFEYERVVNGLIRITWGFFKKLVIADRLALLVNTVYDNPTQFTGNPLIFATYAFAFQIYCDFSAYSDIAIGVARILGIDLMENFQRPYFSRSISEFWRTWHISLSTWFRDYVFYPFRRSMLRRGSKDRLSAMIIPALVTMLLSGLWHGAGWTFIIWGGIHGFLIILDMLWNEYVKPRVAFLKLPNSLETGLGIFITFNLVCLSWIFFRANSLADAWYILRNLFVGLRISSTGLSSVMPGGKYELFIVLCAILLMETIHILQSRGVDLRAKVLEIPVWARWAIYYTLVFAIMIFGVFGLTEFIYIQF